MRLSKKEKVTRLEYIIRVLMIYLETKNSSFEHHGNRVDTFYICNIYSDKYYNIQDDKLLLHDIPELDVIRNSDDGVWLFDHNEFDYQKRRQLKIDLLLLLIEIIKDPLYHEVN